MVSSEFKEVEPCSKSFKKVKWVIDKHFISEIEESLWKDKYEIAGSILFKDINCKGDVCDKQFFNSYIFHTTVEFFKTFLVVCKH